MTTGLAETSPYLEVWSFGEVTLSQIHFSTLEELLELERNERIRRWEDWVSKPSPMQIIQRIKPTTYLSKLLPSEITNQEEAEAFAIEYARHHGVRLCLVLSRRQSVWIDSQGNVEARLESNPDCFDLPLLRLAGNIATFLVE